MNIGLVQLEVVRKEKQVNFRNVERCLHDLCGKPHKPDIVVLPELWSTGYALESLTEISSFEGEEEAEFLGDMAKTYNVWFAGGSVACKTAKGITNRAQVIDRQGILRAYYDKVHLVPMFNEEQFLIAGDKVSVCEIDNVFVGLAVCYDVRFCEFIRSLPLLGAQLIIISAEWPESRISHWQVLIRARAIENQCFVIGVNAAGTGDGHGGNSMIVAPDGEVLTQFGLEEDYQTVAVDIECVRRVRENVPVFSSRRPHMYGIIQKI